MYPISQDLIEQFTEEVPSNVVIINGYAYEMQESSKLHVGNKVIRKIATGETIVVPALKFIGSVPEAYRDTVKNNATLS